MKKFKDILKEFRETTPPPNRGGGAGGGDPHGEIMSFMDKTPFRLNTRQGDLIHFDSSLNAAKTLFKHLAQHEEGHNHAVQSETPHMIKYFQKSAKTHEDALDLVQDMIENHKDLPDHLRHHVARTLSQIDTTAQEEHEINKKGMSFLGNIAGDTFNLGERVMKNYNSHPIEIRGEDFHPHQHDQMHHLEGVVADLEDFMDESGAASGYVIRREEM